MRIQIPIHTPPPEENTPDMTIRRRPVPSASVSESVNGGGEEQHARDPETASIITTDQEIMSNADLYNDSAPPTYTLSAGETETALEAETYVPEKSQLLSHSSNPSYSEIPGTMRPSTSASTSTSATAPGPSAPAPSYSAELPSGHFTQLTDDVALAYVRRCTVLSDRPALWLVRRKNFALSALAATVLLKEDLVKTKDLVLISENSGAQRDPTDPLSAVAFGVYDTVGGVMSGLIAGPAEACRQVTPMLIKYEEKQHGLDPLRNGNSDQIQVSDTQQSARPTTPRPTTPTPGHTPTLSEHPPEKVPLLDQPSVEADASPSQPESSKAASGTAHHGATQIAINSGKGLGKIVGSSLKAPMTFTHGMARGFHNLPKLYGEEVREYENITDMRSGLSVSAKGFGHGLTDGLKDFFVKPVEGAQKEGVRGFAKGFGKGVGNLVCKPSAGAIGLVGYSFVGVYKEISNINFSGKDDAGDIVRYQGEQEYEAASKELKLEIVTRWYQVMSKK